MLTSLAVCKFLYFFWFGFFLFLLFLILIFCLFVCLMSKRELRLTQFFYGGGKGKVDVLGF